MPVPIAKRLGMWMIALTYNLKKYQSFICRKVMARAAAIDKSIQSALQTLIFSFIGRHLSTTKFTEAIFR
jgi:hypothetical protein